MILLAAASDRAVERARANDLAFVVVLAEAERSGVGWERCGVGGWLSVAEIEVIVGRKLWECGSRLVEHGLVQSAALREFGFQRRLYRVTDQGSAWVDALLGRPHQPLKPARLDCERDAARCPIKLQAWGRDARPLVGHGEHLCRGTANPGASCSER
jgi:hypothetical protein